MRIADESQLEQLLSQPREADREALRSLDGDLLILGAGGKMGPTLAVRARRAAELAGVKRRILAVSRFSSEAARQELLSAGIEIIGCARLDRSAMQAPPAT